jgi:hypothetical protein
MAIGTTATRVFNIDEHTTLALQALGMLNPDQGNGQASPGNLALGRKLMLLGVRALVNDGVILRMRERVSMTLTSGTNYVDMAADTVSIEQGGVLRSADGNTDRPIELYSIEQYQRLPNKNTSGVPNFYYPEKQPNGDWRVLFYPVPTTDYPTFVVPRTRKPRDMETGDVDIDLDDKFHLAASMFLRKEFARAKGRRDLAADLKADYMFELERALNDETPRGRFGYTIDDSPWDF